MVCDDVPNILSCFAFLPYFSCPSAKKSCFLVSQMKFSVPKAVYRVGSLKNRPYMSLHIGIAVLGNDQCRL